MQKIAYMVSLIFLMVPLAGCSGTDTEVSVDLSNEEINELIDDNLEDVMNNTTVVVFQEYYNNTTVINQYTNNSTSNFDQTGASTSSTTYNYNGTTSDSEMFVLRLEWDWSDIVESVTLKRNNNFTVDYYYYDYATNNDRVDTFTLPCSNYYDAPEQGSNSSEVGNGPNFWQDNDDYYPWWDYLYNNTIRDLLNDNAYSSEVEAACRESGNEDLLIDSSQYYVSDGDFFDYSNAPIFHEMTIPNGTAIKLIGIATLHTYTYETSWGTQSRQTSVDWTVNGIHPTGCYGLSAFVNFFYDECNDYYGGWEEIHLDFQLKGSVYPDSEFSFTMYYQMVPVTSVL